jgi:phosphatidylserine/phosphatidylglycerophosphate/cardiolipin synthase-like enzyme
VVTYHTLARSPVLADTWRDPCFQDVERRAIEEHTMAFRFRHLAALLSLAAVTACGDADTGSETSNVTELPFAEGSPEALAVLALVNDRDVTFDELDNGVGLDRRAAEGILAHRDGADAVQRSMDDDLFDTLSELDGISYVSTSAFTKLLEYATAQGYYDAQLAKELSAVFSPQPYDASHLPRVAQLIDGALHSIDIAMYSYSDAGIGDALERATSRGVKVRFIFETANKDKNLDGDALANSKSGRLERMGVNVRYVNKIMHHKYVIVDGPRDDLAAADTARIATGSANWSNSAGTKYDENTVLLTGYPELTLRMQAEFNHLWEHSRDFVYDDTLPYELSTLAITEEMIDDNPGAHVFFTSANFDANDTTFSVTGANTVSDAMVEAIYGATESIHIMSGHLRSRPISEALIDKMAQSPELDVRVMLDAQEYISLYKQYSQQKDLDECLERATTDATQRKCLDKGFYFSREIEVGGAEVRYKYYSYRWHYTYALQMHNKVMIVDGDELFTGSYNLSDNAEHNTMENMMMFRGPEFRELVASYEGTFENLWSLARDENRLGSLREEIETASSVPLVFDPMSLTWQEVTDLKDLIRDNCSDVNSSEFRAHPEQHKYCPR